MTITDEQRDQAYETATDQQKLLYASPESGKRLREIANKHNITDSEKYRNYAIAVGDVILGLQERSALPNLLMSALQTTPDQAKSVTIDIVPFLEGKPAPAPQSIPTPPTPPVKPPQPAPTKTDAPAAQPTWSTASEPAPPVTPVTPVAVPPKATPPSPPAPSPIPSPNPRPVPTIRTMAADMEKNRETTEKVYTTTQEAILREGRATPQTNVPTPTPKQ